MKRVRERLQTTGQLQLRSHFFECFNFIRVLTARRTYFETNLQNVDSQIALRQADVVLSGLLLTGGLSNVANPGVGAGILGGVGQRGQALSGQ